MNCPVCGQPCHSLPVTLLPERGMVVANGKFTVLTGKEMAILELLADRFPRVLSKDAILSLMYQFEDEPEIKIIDVFICKLRKKIEPIGVRIDTAWGKGYGLAVSEKPVVVQPLEDDAA